MPFQIDAKDWPVLVFRPSGQISVEEWKAGWRPAIEIHFEAELEPALPSLQQRLEAAPSARHGALPTP